MIVSGVVSRWSDRGAGGRTSRASSLWGGSADARVCRGGGCCTLASTRCRREPRNHAEQQRRWRPRLGSHVRRPPSPHMGAKPPHTPVSRKAHNSNKTSPRLAEAPPSHVQHQQTAMPNRRTPDAPTMLYTEIGPRPAQDRSDSARPPRRRSTHNKLRERRPPAAPRNHRQAADPQQRNRSRRGIRPISRQSTTDLEPEYDRYRRGLRPISTRGAGHRATVYGRRPASPRARTTSSL